jgi:hypothetical protein
VTVPWVNLDDKFTEHPKVDSLSDAAFRLHVAGICYCNRLRTDGLISYDRIARLVPRFHKKALDELLTKGIWYDRFQIQVYEIHDYLQWNDSRDEIDAFREKQRQNAKRRWSK